MTTSRHVLPRSIRGTASKTCRFCGAGLQRTFVDLGMSPLCETYPSSAELNQGEIYYPLHVYVCENCLAGATGGIRERGEDFQRLRLLLFLFGLMAQTLRKLLRQNGRALRPGTAELCGRGGQQRRLSFAVFRAAGRAGAGNRARRQCGEGGGRERRSDAGAVFRCTTGKGNGGRRPVRRSGSRQQRPGAGS